MLEICFICSIIAIVGTGFGYTNQWSEFLAWCFIAFFVGYEIIIKRLDKVIEKQSREIEKMERL